VVIATLGEFGFQRAMQRGSHVKLQRDQQASHEALLAPPANSSGSTMVVSWFVIWHPRH
jgi:predicted RNA binding protein YcfA (HicA-like mRNA interferase family)